MKKRKLLIALCSTVIIAGQVVEAEAQEVTEKWAALYDGSSFGSDRPNAMQVDGFGNVYVTGESSNGSNWDYATVKYDSQGNQLWAARYNGQINSVDYAEAIATDQKGNVYVTGASVSDTNYDYLTIKYDADGNEQWIARYDGFGGHDWGKAIAVDGNGNVYVTGASEAGPFGGANYLTIKYDSNGNQLWVQRYDGPGSGNDFATSLVLDHNNNVLITGGSSGDGTGEDYATVKYDTDGNLKWLARYDNGAGDRANQIIVDDNGNVFITGASIGDGTTDFATVKYDEAGNQLWLSRYNGPGNTYDEAKGIALDGSGDVIVTGYVDGVLQYVNSYFGTIKYDGATGQEQWQAFYNPGPTSVPQAVTVDGSGNVYVVGYNSANNDYATVKYNTAGVQIWEALYDGPGNGTDAGFGMAIDAKGCVYVTGSAVNTLGNTDYGTVKYCQGVQTCN